MNTFCPLSEYIVIYPDRCAEILNTHLFQDGAGEEKKGWGHGLSGKIP